MPLNSVQKLTLGIIQGLAIPGSTAPLTAFITPPMIEDLNGPRAYVWGGRLRGDRQTAPRRQGFKNLNWTIDVYLSYLTTPDSAGIDEQFPALVDAVMAATWATTIPLMIDGQGQPVDAANAPPGATQILSLGENFELEYPPERSPSDLRLLYYTCRLGLDVQEKVQG
jgi:hypothetical protein